MTPTLQLILDAEIALGNTVAEVSAWPPKCHLFVLLKRPFHNQYVTSAGVEFSEVDDSHYWKAEYRASGSEEVLACGF
jgi:hypothetical protein